MKKKSTLGKKGAIALRQRKEVLKNLPSQCQEKQEKIGRNKKKKKYFSKKKRSKK